MIKEFMEKVCGLGRCEGCCKFLIGGSGGFECGKASPELREFIEKKEGMTARGDNCGGFNRMRLVADDEFSGFKKGDVVYRWLGPTYGCVSEVGIPVSVESGMFPFVEVATENIEEYPQEIPG